VEHGTGTSGHCPRVPQPAMRDSPPQKRRARRLQSRTLAWAGLGPGLGHASGRSQAENPESSNPESFLGHRNFSCPYVPVSIGSSSSPLREAHRHDSGRAAAQRCCSMNRDVVVGSDLVCPDLSFELHTVLLRVLPLCLKQRKVAAKPIIGAQNICWPRGKTHK
jgi:hypothetical protein